MPHKTEVPGQIGEMRAIEFFLNHGWEVDVPVLRSSSYDIHVHKGSRNFFVQCKYRRVYKGVVQIKNRRVRNKGIRYEYDKDKIGIFTVFVPTLNQGRGLLLVIPSDRMNKSLSIRVEESRNGQKCLTNKASEFINPKWILDGEKETE